jgi:hypothetical protein
MAGASMILINHSGTLDHPLFAKLNGQLEIRFRFIPFS